MSVQTGTATDYQDLLSQLNAFLTAQGMTLAPSYTGTGNGTISGLIGGSASAAELITLTATDATHFSVSGSASGAIGTAVVGTPFTSTKINFTITAGGTAFVAGDVFTVTTTPPWLTKRAITASFVTALGTLGTVANAFNGVITDYAQSASALPLWVGAQFSRAFVPGTFAIISSASLATEAPKNFTLDWSDDGTTWTTAITPAAQTAWGLSEKRTFTVTGTPGAHKYWRVNITTNNGGTNTTVAEFFLYESGQTLATSHPSSSGGVGFMNYIWQAPGNAGTDAIYCGALTFNNTTADYWNWRLGGFTAFDANLNWDAQAGFMGTLSTTQGPQGSPIAALWNGSIPYWFIGSGRRVIVISKVSTVYEMVYLGFINTYPSPNQFPYPLLIGGSMAFNSEPAITSPTFRWSDQSNSHCSFPFGNLFQIGTTDKISGCRLRRADGAWRGFSGSSSEGSGGCLFPYGQNMLNIKPNLDGSYPLFPVVLYETNTLAPNVYGELDGVVATTGQGNSVESTITVAGVTYLVIQNVFRNTVTSFCAVRLI